MPPTHTRYRVVALATLLAMVTYLDRVCISKLAPDLLVSVPSDLFGGVVTDRLASRFGLKVGRCMLDAVAYLISAVALVSAAASSDPVTAAVLIAVATGACMFTLGAAWGTCSEVGRNHIGVVGAVMNTAGQIASLLCPLLVAYSVSWFGSWDFPLYFMGGLFFLGAGCWLIIDPERPVFGPASGVARTA